MRKIILSFATTILISFCTCEAAAEECKRNVPTNCWDKHVVPYFRQKTYCGVMLEGVKDNKKELNENCKENIKPYLKSNLEEEDTVKEFAQSCKASMKESWSRCVNILTHFNSPELCWNMKTAKTLFYIFHKKNFLSDTELKSIDFKHSDYLYFKEAHIYLDFGQTVKYANENSLANTMALLNFYRNLRDDFINKNNIKSTACDCGQIIGIYKFYGHRKAFESSKRKNPNEYDFKNLTGDEKNELADLYRSICLEYRNGFLRIFWPISVLQELAKSAQYITFKMFPILIKKASGIPESGWFRSDMPEKNWPVDFVISKIMPNGNEEINSDEIFTISEAIKFGFSLDTYKEYVNLINKYEGINSVECQNKIIDSVMRKIDTPHYRPNAGYWIKKTNKDSFVQHLKLMLDMYNKTRKKGCEYFTTNLVTSENVFFYYRWTEESFNGYIKSATDSGMTMKQFSECLIFVKNVNEFSDREFAPYKVAKRDKYGYTYYRIKYRKGWKPNEDQREHFRMKLFAHGDKATKLCSSEVVNIDINYFKSLIKVYRQVLKWKFPPESKEKDDNIPDEEDDEKDSDDED